MVNSLLGQLNSYENELVKMLADVTKTKMNLLGAYNMYNNTRTEEDKTIYIPYAAFEEQLARFQEEKQGIMEFHKEEKKAMREHYKKIIKWISITLITFIVAVFASVIWFLNNYDIATYTQDGYGLNNYIKDSTQGDIIYGATDSGNIPEE